MTLAHLYLFLVEHPDWSPCLRLHGSVSGESALMMRIETAGVVAPSGQVYKLEAVARAMEKKDRG